MTPMGGGTPLPFPYDALSLNVRRDSGRARVWLVQPALHPVLSAREGSLPFGGQVTMNANASRRTSTSQARSPAPSHCTTTATSAGRATSSRKSCPCSDQPSCLLLAKSGVVTYPYKLFDAWADMPLLRCCTAHTSSSAQLAVNGLARGLLPLLASTSRWELCTPHHDHATAASLHCTSAPRPHPNTGRPPGRPIAAVGLPQAS